MRLRPKSGWTHGAPVLLAALIVSSCGSEGVSEESGGGGVCAFVVTFRGERYEGRTVLVEPEIGKLLGEAVIPPCGAAAEDGTGDRIPVRALKGVDPSVAVVWEGEPSRILVREGESIPEELERSFERPACDPASEPIGLFGTWVGIIGPNETTELDLEPPYDLEMLVLEATDPAYEGADLIVHVPASSGRLITRPDIRTSLWEGGSIDIEAGCDGDRFVATSARTYPG